MTTVTITAADPRIRRMDHPLAGLVWLVPALAVVLLLFGGGLVLGLLQSLGYAPGVDWDQLTLAHFRHIVTDRDFLPSLGLTTYIAVGATTLAALISVAFALAINALPRHSAGIRFIFQIPLTVPHLVIAVAMMFLLAPSGLLARCALNLGWIKSSAAFPLLVNDPWGFGIMVTYIWKEVPFISLMLIAVLRQRGDELLQVGRTLKAGRWQRFRYITLPVIFPSLGAACLIVFAYTFGAFEVPYLLGRTHPMLLPVWAYKSYSDVDLLARPEGIAIGLMIAGVVILAVVLSQLLTGIARKRGVVL